MMHSNLPTVTAPQVYLYTTAVDMRRSFNGLMSIVQAQFEQDVLSGDLFVFLNRRGDRIKALWWDGDGLAIFMKRLEGGTYQRLTSADQKHVRLDRTELGLFLSGIELSSVRRRKRYQPTKSTT